MLISRSAGCVTCCSGSGFEMRVRGSHHIFIKEGVEEILNLQPRGADAKPYQVKQVRNAVLKYKMAEEKL